MKHIITPDECLPNLVTVEVEVNGIRGTLTCHKSEADKCIRVLTDAILNRNKEEE